MVMLSIDSLKLALNYILNNSTTVKYYESGRKKGLIVTDDMSEDEAYHIRVVELLEPKLITQLAESFTTLSLAGQELLDVLSDDVYLDSLVDYLKRQGYTNPSDRQVFRLLQSQLEKIGNNSWQDVMQNALLHIASPNAANKLKEHPAVMVSPAALQDINTSEYDKIAAPQFTDTVQLEPTVESSIAEQLIADTKKKITK